MVMFNTALDTKRFMYGQCSPRGVSSSHQRNLTPQTLEAPVVRLRPGDERIVGSHLSNRESLTIRDNFRTSSGHQPLGPAEHKKNSTQGLLFREGDRPGLRDVA